MNGEGLKEEIRVPLCLLMGLRGVRDLLPEFLPKSGSKSVEGGSETAGIKEEKKKAQQGPHTLSVGVDIQ